MTFRATKLDDSVAQDTNVDLIGATLSFDVQGTNTSGDQPMNRAFEPIAIEDVLMPVITL